MEEQGITLCAYKQEVEILTLQMDVPVYEGERASWFPKYEDVLLKLFNNKRENKEILEIRNYYGSNAISMTVNLTEYMEGSSDTKEECIEHLVEWFKCGLDIKDEDVKQYLRTGTIYTIPEWENKMEGDNYLELEM